MTAVAGRRRVIHGLVETATLFRETFSKWDAHDALTQSAALAFYTLFSLVPILILVIALAGAVFGRDAVRGQIVHQFATLMGEKQSLAVKGMLTTISVQDAGWLARAIGIVTLVLAATAAFVQLQISLNLVWEVAPKPGPLIRSMLKKRIISFALVIGIGFLLSVSLALSAALQSLREFTAARVPLPVPFLEGIHLLTSFLIFALLFAAIFRILPDAEIAWRDVWLGSIVTSFLFSVGKYLIGLYLGRSSLTSPFGSAGSLVLIILWVYYASLILLFGAEFTRVYSLRVSAASPRPSPGGERVRKVAIDRTTRRPKRPRIRN
ncbi:MAG: YihY/virulence factor BrkB family protein [Acidobacteriota bacterium]|nr:YihY/virulence factor BrkB family protein [Acidobacteriota bacterium]